ncbi:MAG TPA: helix-turn-helix domain-containing protein [Acidimicrobiia bacterium]|jgi:excisionase family DNA binding protein|nr:helix-turn-helix domain-containing protein [Acidimicrobiia bacterium]
MDTAETRPSDDRPPRLLSAQEVADYLGVPITTIYNWRHRSQGPPGLRVGRHLRYRRRDVEAWIERQLDDPTP